MKTIYSAEHKKIVEKLKKARKDACLDQKEAAKLLHRTQSYVSKAESGQRRLDVVQLKAFCKIYGKQIGYFLGG